MVGIDCNTLSLKELHNMEKEVRKAIESENKRRREVALKRLDDLAQELGFNSVSEIMDVEKAKKQLLKPKPYFRDPNNPKNTATKMGRKPNWFKVALLSGYTEDDLRIK